VPRSGWFRKRQPAPAADGTVTAKPSRPRLRGRPGAAWTAAGVAMIAVAGVIVAFGSPGSHAAPVSAARAAAKQDRSAGPLRVVSVTPADSAKGVNGAAPIRVRFSAPLAAGTGPVGG